MHAEQIRERLPKLIGGIPEAIMTLIKNELLGVVGDMNDKDNNNSGTGEIVTLMRPLWCSVDADGSLDWSGDESALETLFQIGDNELHQQPSMPEDPSLRFRYVPVIMLSCSRVIPELAELREHQSWVYIQGKYRFSLFLLYNTGYNSRLHALTWCHYHSDCAYRRRG
jgi:hypothetical protein